MAESLAEVRAREAGRTWQMLVEGLEAVAAVRAEVGEAAAFRMMQALAMRVGRRRVELIQRAAALEMAPQ